VQWGYGQVEPNHLSAQKTAQIYAQLPAAADIDILEQGQFVKYDYAKGLVDFEGAGEWMLVFNEIKLYRDGQDDCEFAMLKDNYQARIYSPYGGNKYGDDDDPQSRYYNGVDAEGKSEITLGDNTYKYDDVTAGPDIYEPRYNEDPFHVEPQYTAAKMPEGTTMVPRVFKTNVGDIFTTNTVNAETLAVGDTLKVGDKGILEAGTDDKMTWQVVKVYNLPDRQAAVKIMRIV
jgi:hypothetical protein